MRTDTHLVRIPEYLHTELKVYAAANKKSLKSMLVVILSDYFARKAKEKKAEGK